jgi:hypothetical protein
MRRFAASLTVAAVFSSPLPLDAWGFDGHKFIMAEAIPRLPAEIRPFFLKFRDTIVEHTIDPDLWRTVGWEAESPRHFVDMDAYGPHPFKDLPHDYEQAVQRFGREFVDKNGTLPWRTEEIYGKLVDAFAQKGPYSRENIKFFSSVLAHYVADAHVPFHAALNHDGQLTGQWGIHSRFESELFDRHRARLTIAPKPLFPVPSARELAFAALTDSFSFVQPILEADKTAVGNREVYDDEYFELFFGQVKPIIERRLVDSITAVGSIITAAWVEAGRPALPPEQKPSPPKARRK